MSNLPPPHLPPASVPAPNVPAPTEPIPVEPPPLVKSRPAGRDPRWRWVIALVAAGLVGLATFLLVRSGGGDEPTVSPPDSPPTDVVTTPPAPDDRLATVLAEVEAARADVERLTARAEELRAQVLDGPDPSLLQNVRQAIDDAEAALAAAETRAALPAEWVPLAITQTVVGTVAATYDVQWEGAFDCLGTAECTSVGANITRFYIDTDPATGEFRLVVPNVVIVPLGREGNALFGSAPMTDSGLACGASPAPADASIYFGPGLVGPDAEGSPRVDTLVGNLFVSTDLDSDCPDVQGLGRFTAVRAS